MSKSELYQEIGRKVVQIARQAEIVSFAAKAAKKGAGKSHNCNPSKSHSCTRPDGSNYCISLNRKCRAPATGTAKQAADYVGGKIVLASKSDMASTAKPDAKGAETKAAEPTASSVTDLIDRKYASDNPTDEQADKWLKERLDQHVSPEGLALQSLLRKNLASPGSVAWDEQPEYVRNATDRDSYVKAAIQKERDYYKANKENFSWKSFSGMTDMERAKMEKTLANPKTSDATKAKLQKKLDEDKARSEDAYQRMLDRYTKPIEERKKEVEGEFDKAVKDMKGESADLRKKIKDGDVRTIQSKTEEILRRSDTYRPENLDDTPLDNMARHREIAKEYLSSRSSALPPNEVLGIKAGATPDEIKTAYRKLAAKNHPDKGGDVNEFQKITAAYDKLRSEMDFSEFIEMGDVLFEVRNP